MNFKLAFCRLASLFLLMAGGNSALAEIVIFNFTGTVTNRFNNGLPDPSDIFGLTVNVGNSVTGSFTIDTSAPLLGSVTGTTSGALAGYTQSLPSIMRFNLAGSVFTSDGNYASSISNDFRNSAASSPLEQFRVSDGVSSGSQNLTGDTILLNNSPETAQMAVTFTDVEATAFNSISLPTSLNLSLFETREGTISGTRPSGQANPFFYSVAFRIDSITAVPEPTSMAFCLAVIGVAVFHRARMRGMKR